MALKKSSLVCLLMLIVFISPVFCDNDHPASNSTLRPVNLDAFCTQPDKRTLFKWKYIGKTNRNKLACRVTNFSGKAIYSGDVELSSGKDVTFEYTFQKGYYEISFPELSCSFGIISLPKFHTDDPFFCMDSVLNGYKDLDRRRLLIKRLKQLGINMVRERFTYMKFDKEETKWDQPPMQSESTRKIYSQNGIKLLELIKSVPRWYYASPEFPVFPADLNKAAELTRKMMLHYGHSWGAYEIWNEPNLIGLGGTLPGDHYTAYLKTVSNVLRNSPNKVCIVGGAWSAMSPEFMNTCADNGMLKHVDAISFHDYADIYSLPKNIRKMREWVTRYGRPGLPIWLSEYGQPLTNASNRQRSLPAENLSFAMNVSMSAIEAKACGIARVFPFIYRAYEEPGKFFGLMGKEDTPLPQLGAYINALQQISDKDYVGDLPILPGSDIKRLRVFYGKNDKEAIAVYYTGVNRKIIIKSIFKTLKIIAIDGSEVKQETYGSIPISNGLAYVHYPWELIKDKLITATDAMQLNKMARAPAGEKAAACNLVLQPKVLTGYNTATTTKSGYLLNHKPGEKAPFAIRCHNLQAKSRNVIIQFNIPYSLGKILEPASRNVLIKANGFVDLEWNVIMASNPVFMKQFKWEAIAVDAATSKQLDYVCGFIKLTTDDFATISRIPGKKIFLPVTKGKWVHNIVQGGKSILTAFPDGIFRMEAVFKPDTPKWYFPNYYLPDDVKLKNNWTLVIRMRHSKGCRFLIFIDEKDKGARFHTLTPPVDGDDEKWHNLIVQPSMLTLFPDKIIRVVNQGLNLDNVNRFEIGFTQGAVDKKTGMYKGWLEISKMMIIYPND